MSFYSEWKFWVDSLDSFCIKNPKLKTSGEKISALRSAGGSTEQTTQSGSIMA